MRVRGWILWLNYADKVIFPRSHAPRSSLYTTLSRLPEVGDNQAVGRAGIPAGMMVFRRYLCIKTSALRVNEADSGLDGVVKVENPGYLMLIKANLPGGIAERFCCF